VDNGILAPVAGVLGSLQALQAIKVILNLGEQLVGELMMIDALDLNFRKIRIQKDPGCDICS
jgi:adenylyltransferase/sulfurtransferase